MPGKRIFRPRNRLSGVRDARLIVIAAEGTKTEKRYFEDLAAAYRNAKVHLEVLDRVDSASAPERVIAQLDTFKAEYRIRKGFDELWLVIDFDHWGDEKLAEVCRRAVQKHYDLAVSNPCFEFWLLLHHRSPHDYPEEELLRLRENRRDGTNRTRLERELIALLGRYNKDNPAAGDFIPHVHRAIARARELDQKPEERWPNDLGSRVYRLALRIIA